MGTINCDIADKIVEESKLPVGFEIHATYSDVDGESKMTSCTITGGKVLICPKVYNVAPLTFSGDSATVYLHCYKISNTETDNSWWETTLSTTHMRRDMSDKERVVNGFYIPLLVIKDGWLVEDNRQMICLNTARKDIPGKANIEYMGQIDCVEGVITECPYSGVIDTLEGHLEECESMLGQLGA